MMSPEARLGLYLGTHPDDANALWRGSWNGFKNSINPINWLRGTWNTIAHPKKTFNETIGFFKYSLDVMENGTSEEQFELMGNFYGSLIGSYVFGETVRGVGKISEAKINRKNIPINKISNNPKDDIFKRGYNESSVSYQKKYYSQNGKFDTTNEPIVVYDLGEGNYMMQNGHHRLKTAQDLGLESLKVDEIIPYSQSVELGVTDLPLNKIPRE